MSVSTDNHCGEADKEKGATYRDLNVIKREKRLQAHSLTRVHWEPQSKDITAMYGRQKSAEHKQFEDYHFICVSFSVGLCHSQLSVHDACWPERAGIHTRDGLSITSHPAGSSEGCCPAWWEAVGEAGGEAGEGVGVSGGEARAWGVAVRASCPAVWKLSRPHGSSRRCLRCRMFLTNRAAVTSSVCIWEVWSAGLFERTPVCVFVCVLDCHECL